MMVADGATQEELAHAGLMEVNGLGTNSIFTSGENGGMAPSEEVQEASKNMLLLQGLCGAYTKLLKSKNALSSKSYNSCDILTKMTIPKSERVPEVTKENLQFLVQPVPLPTATPTAAPTAVPTNRMSGEAIIAMENRKEQLIAKEEEQEEQLEAASEKVNQVSMAGPGGD